MRTICFYFQVHQPFRLRRYRFFDIGNDHYYYDDYANRTIMRKVAEKCYLPTNRLMLDLIREHGGRFKICYSISGVALEQFQMYAPDVLDTFRELAKTGCVEFLSETYSHSLSALKSKEEFFEQVRLHDELQERLLGVKTSSFRNTELIYSDWIGEMVAEMGFKAMLTEGAKHILGWKSPNYLYYNANNPKMKVLLKNFKLSDDIAFRFSNRAWEEWPLTTEKYVHWLNQIPRQEEILNLFMDYETFGEHQWEDSGIFHFLRALPRAVFSLSDFTFSTPSEVAEHVHPVAAINVPYPISWADEERDLTAWLGNELQWDSFDSLYSLTEMVRSINDPNIQRDWRYLQTSDHFYYMCTKFFSDGDVHKYFNPYDTPYESFITFMNVLTDFTDRVKKAYQAQRQDEIEIPENISEDEAKKLLDKFTNAVETLKAKINPSDNEPKWEKESETKQNVEEKPKKAPAKKVVKKEKKEEEADKKKVEPKKTTAKKSTKKKE